MKKYIIISLAVFIIFITACTTTQTGFAINDLEMIKIGYIGPLVGDAAFVGITEKAGIDVAVDEINNNGGVNSKKLEVIFEDGKCNAKGGLTAAKKLIDMDKVQVILSGCSAETLGAAPAAEENKVILLTSWASNSAITNAGDYVFRSCYSNDDTARIAAEVILKDHNKIGIISETTPYAIELRDLLKKHLLAEGATIYDEVYETREKDTRTQIIKILGNNPDAIFLNPDTVATGEALLKQLKILGYKGSIYGNFFGSSVDIAVLPEADGLVFFADPAVEDNPRKRLLVEKYIAMSGKDPEFEFPLTTRYDSVYIIKNAIEAVGYNATKIKDYLYTMEPYDGILGDYSFDSNGDAVGIVPAVNQIKDGKVVKYITVSQHPATAS